MNVVTPFCLAESAAVPPRTPDIAPAWMSRRLSPVSADLT